MARQLSVKHLVSPMCSKPCFFNCPVNHEMLLRFEYASARFYFDIETLETMMQRLALHGSKQIAPTLLAQVSNPKRRFDSVVGRF